MDRITQGDVTLTQTGFDRFTVQYGKQIRKGLDYSAAAAQFGSCVMHQAACDGRLDVRTRAEAREDGDTAPYFELV